MKKTQIPRTLLTASQEVRAHDPALVGGAPNHSIFKPKPFVGKSVVKKPKKSKQRKRRTCVRKKRFLPCQEAKELLQKLKTVFKKGVTSAMLPVVNRVCTDLDRLESLKSLQGGGFFGRVKAKGFKQILVTLQTRMDWSSYRIGVPTTECMMPLAHKSLLALHNKIHDLNWSESTWYRYWGDLKDAGYLSLEFINVVEGYDEENNGQAIIRSKAAKKYFSYFFFKELGFSDEWLEEQQLEAVERLKKNNLCTNWYEYGKKKYMRAKALLNDQIPLVAYQQDQRSDLDDFAFP